MADAQLRAVITAEDKASQVIAKVGGSLDQVKSKLETATEASQKVALGLAGIGLAAAGFAAKGVQVAGQLEAMRQGFVTLLGSAEAADKTMERIKQEAARTPFELPGLTSATQALALVTKDGDKAIDVLLNVGKALASAGKGQAELDRIISNLQQIALTGNITEMDIRQFGMNGVNVLQILADYYGTTTEAAGEMVKNSSDAFGDLTKAFEKAGTGSGQFAKGFENQAGTFQQLWSNLMDTINVKLADFVKNTGIFDAVKGAIQRLIDVLPALLEKIEKTIQFFSEHKELLAIIAGIIGGALYLSIKALTLAIYGMTSALAPYIIGGAIIGGLVAGILWIIKHWEDIKTKAVEIWGAIASFLSETWNSIKGGVVSKWNEIKDYIVNTWQGLSDSTKGWLLLLGTIVTGGLLFVVLKVIEHWDQIKQKTQEAWGAVVEFLRQHWDTILAVVLGPLGLLIAHIIKNWDTIKTKTSEVWNAIKDATTQAWDSVKDYFVGIWDDIKGVFNSAIDSIMKKLDPLINAIDRIKSGASSIGNSVGKSLNSLGSSLNKGIGVNDAIISPDGRIITTHPDDYLIATKNPAELVGAGGTGNSGGATIHLTITGNTFVGREGIAEQIGNDLMRIIKRNALL